MGEDSSRREELGRDVYMARVEGVLDPSYRLATVMLLDYGAAEDAVHDAAVRAWAQYRKLNGDVTSFRTWFLAIVAAECRRVGRWRPFGPRRRDADRGGAGGLHEVLGRLPLPSRAALFCHVSLDLPMDEVARVLQMSHAAVRSHVYSAEVRVHAELERVNGNGNANGEGIQP
jgi:DNA-directed RNA polymerase specialized sigma24 family protein